VSEKQTELEDSGSRPVRRGPSRKYPWAILIVLLLFVIVPFISWYGTWFGRPLSDEKLLEYLHDREKPRNAQHALSQLASRIEKHDPEVKRWYPEIIAAASSPSPEVRLTAAWVMGQDNTSDEFHSALQPMLNDPSPGVRHNTALALVRFGDASARPELTAMLQPRIVKADWAGKVELLAKEEGMAVAAGGPLVRIKRSDGSTGTINADEAARVEFISVTEGSQVEAGSELMTLLPSTDQVWETLRAFFVVGEADDIPAIERYTRPLTGMPDRVRQQAVATIQEIRDRNQPR
jgi:hypothetical protein